jgi:hypothetical protein
MFWIPSPNLHRPEIPPSVHLLDWLIISATALRVPLSNRRHEDRWGQGFFLETHSRAETLTAVNKPSKKLGFWILTSPIVAHDNSHRKTFLFMEQIPHGSPKWHSRSRADVKMALICCLSEGTGKSLSREKVGSQPFIDSHGRRSNAASQYHSMLMPTCGTSSFDPLGKESRGRTPSLGFPRAPLGLEMGSSRWCRAIWRDFGRVGRRLGNRTGIGRSWPEFVSEKKRPLLIWLFQLFIW